MTEPLYSLEGVGRSFSKGGVTVDAVRSIDLDIAQGEMVSIEGPSGSGKSTLLQLLGALDTPTRGSLRFDGRELARESDKSLTGLRSKEIGFVFQHFNLIPTLTAQENVSVAMVPAGIPHAKRAERATELLEQVGLGHRVDHLPSRLSGGEQQRVAIARALSVEPRVVLADEPTGNLDSATGGEIIELLASLAAEHGSTVIVATHDSDLAARAPQRLAMRDGRLVGNPEPAAA